MQLRRKAAIIFQALPVFLDSCFALDTECALCYTHECIYTKNKRKETKTMTATVFTKKYKICPVEVSVFYC